MFSDSVRTPITLRENIQFEKLIEAFEDPTPESAAKMKQLAKEALGAKTIAGCGEKLQALRKLCSQNPKNLKIFTAFIRALPEEEKRMEVLAGESTRKIPQAVLFAQLNFLIPIVENYGLEEAMRGQFNFRQVIVDGEDQENPQLSEDLFSCLENMSSEGILSGDNVMGLLIFAIDYQISWLLDDCTTFLVEAYSECGTKEISEKGVLADIEIAEGAEISAEPKEEVSRGEEIAEFLINLGSRAQLSKVLHLTDTLTKSLSSGKEIARCIQMFDSLEDINEKSKFYDFLEQYRSIVSSLTRLSTAENIEFLKAMGPPQSWKPLLRACFNGILSDFKKKYNQGRLSDVEMSELLEVAKKNKFPNLALVIQNNLRNVIRFTNSEVTIVYDGVLDQRIHTLLTETKNPDYDPRISLCFTESIKGHKLTELVDVAQIISLLKDNLGITTLNLRKVVEIEGVRAILSALEVNTTLKELDLSQNLLTDEIIPALLQFLEVNKTIQIIKLDGSDISKENIEKIQQILEARRGF